MNFVLWTSLGFLLIIVLVQIIWANRFVALYSVRNTDVPVRIVPRVGVVLALRGSDPYLAECLRGLMTQNHPNHEIRIVVDSEFDSAFSIIRSLPNVLDAKHVVIEILKVNCDSCSLKNLALIQGIANSSDACEVYVWLDSDTVPTADWLSNLTAPLENPEIGATSGIRWYAPQSKNIGDLARHIWNAGAMLQMVEYGIGWGGSFAVRRSVYEEGQLADRWLTAMTEDTLTSDVVTKMGLKLRFVGKATMVNQESASLNWCVSFVTRQMQLLRSYHRAWTQVLAGGLFVACVAIAGTTSSVISIVRGQYLGPLTAICLSVGAVWCAAWLLRRSERVIAKSTGLTQEMVQSPYRRLVLAIPVAVSVFVIALIKSYLIKKVCWRGINYDLRPGKPPLRCNYAPYTISSGKNATMDSHSI